LLKLRSFTLPFLFFILCTFPTSIAKSSDSFQITPTTEHHVAALNSNLPYVAGFHVIAEDLSLRENVNATEVTVSFPSTQPELFPPDSWLGGGMFVQGQDHVFRNVDYGFYMMLVLDASGRLFVDIGLHQTEEATLPLQNPTSSLVYSYTWQISGLDPSTPVTLIQSWDSNGIVDYSLSFSGIAETLTAVNVTNMPNCQNIIPKFYAGNVVIDPFPFSRYINYFQFGIMSNQPITNSDWHVDLKEPKTLSQTGWVQVDKAWSLQGDHSYLDHDLMWGGAIYPGVDAQYYEHPLQNPYELIFSYSNDTMASGKVLWDLSNINTTTVGPFAFESQDLTMLARRFLPLVLTALGVTIALPFLLVKRMKRKTEYHKINS